MRRRIRWMSSGTATAPASSRYSGARKLMRQGSCCRRGEGAPERDAERRVGRHDLVADAERSEHRAPFADHLLHRVAIRHAHVGHARRHAQVALRVGEQRFAARRQLAFGRDP